MKRIDRIYEYIHKRSEEYSIEKLKVKAGFSASEIGDELNIQRNNVSKELNTLLRLGKVIKIKGRPVLYFDKDRLEMLTRNPLLKSIEEIENINELILPEPGNEAKSKSPFDYLIGSGLSLKNQIEQAKAAVLYPPNGLHTLILGQTGVGKTLFAHTMYNYAKYAGKLKEDSPFVVFNCADYYSNTQLLISQIFGHLKGAFTGAESEKYGLVEKADGGILFLDEIHRLPPEGQEMIFYFMDTGNFNKLGETERKRKANVLIIGATTENPNSSLLKTFIRRIPIVINIPSLEEREPKEKLEIIKHLLSLEAARINKPIKTTEEVIKALLGSTTFGNIGQLKSNIQLICAKGFLNSIDNKELIELDFKTLPPNIKDGFFTIGSNRKDIEEIAKYIDSTIIIMPNGNKVLFEVDAYEPPFNLYKIIEDKTNMLKDEGMDDEYIRNFITTDINIHIKSFYEKFKVDAKNRDRILNIISEDMFELVEEIQQIAEKKLNRKYNERFLYALGLHISAFLKRVKNGMNVKYTNIDNLAKDNPSEYEVALEIKNMLEERFKIIVPDMECMYLTLLLTSIQDVKKGYVGVLVAAHGNSTASSMVNVAEKLLGKSRTVAVDMPLEVSPMQILDVIIKKAKEIDMGKGVLLLVDMGSLSNFESLITEKTNIQIRTIDMVSTPLVIEAVRRSMLLDMDLDSIYDSLREFRGYSSSLKEIDEDYSKAIITVCSTGEGTAKKLKEMIENIINKVSDEHIKVISLGLKDLNKIIKTIKSKYNIIATVGVAKPDVAVPFISLESLIEGRGERTLTTLITGENNVDYENKDRIVVEDLCEDNLKQFLVYLNPHKIISVLIDFSSVLEKNMNTTFSNSMAIRLIIHTACALERMVTGDGLKYENDALSLNQNVLLSIRKASRIFDNLLKLRLTEDEIAYIAEMFN